MQSDALNTQIVYDQFEKSEPHGMDLINYLKKSKYRKAPASHLINCLYDPHGVIACLRALYPSIKPGLVCPYIESNVPRTLSNHILTFSLP